ncbi:MAG TPA: DUF2905 domain-containing protein [Gemmatimonadales bacterium]|jgi:DUF2905 family protein|nr:DUF2905 domain-containing protein [Gemmatimonadales bacterium]
MNASPGPVIVLAGVALVLVGLAVWSGALGWFGRLPGDIRIERDSMRIYIPLASMLLISAVLTLLMYLLNRLR